MNDTQRQFIAICPKCAATLRVNFKHLGRNVCCNKCRCTFMAGEAIDQQVQRPELKQPAPAIPPAATVDRIPTVCPGCQATLHVRRNYIGNQVRCKHCDRVFRVLASAETLLETKQNGRDSQHESLQAEHEQLYVAHNLLEAEHERLKTQYNRLSKEFHRVTADLVAILAALGSLSPADICSLAEDREALVAAAHRLRNEIQALRQEQSAPDPLAAAAEQKAPALDKRADSSAGRSRVEPGPELLDDISSEGRKRLNGVS